MSDSLLDTTIDNRVARESELRWSDDGRYLNHALDWRDGNQERRFVRSADGAHTWFGAYPPGASQFDMPDKVDLTNFNPQHNESHVPLLGMQLSTHKWLDDLFTLP